MRSPNVITDLGNSYTLDLPNGEKMYIPRYAAWSHDSNKDKLQVVESSDDVEYLKRKYNTDKVL